jgi:hypothetical protein
MLSVLERQHDGTLRSAARIKRLNDVLLKDPARFWDEFWSEMTADDPTRKQAESLLCQLGPDATFADLRNTTVKGGDGQ